MIVTHSRLHAVRYRLAVDKYLAERDYPFKALVAFSGKVEDGGQSYTESGMNGVGEAQTAKTFDQAAYRFLIVANKFQTGFDFLVRSGPGAVRLTPESAKVYIATRFQS